MIKMKNLNRIFLVSALLFSFTFAKAQFVTPLDFMRMNPYQMKSNPAVDLPYQSVFSMLIGNASVGIQNTSLFYDNCFNFDAQGIPRSFNLRSLAAGLSPENYLGFEANNNFFTLYRRLNKGMLTISLDLRMQGEMSYTDGLIKMLAYGNSIFVGENNPAVMNVNANMKAFQQIAVGYQLNVTDKLSIGARGKLLLGLANVTTDAFDVRLYTDPDSYAIRLQENIGMRMNVPRVLMAEDGRLRLNKDIGIVDLWRDPGFGVDLGAEYHITDQIGVVAAVTDLGFISWSGNPIKLTGKINDAGEYYDNGDFVFDGLEWSDIQNMVSDPAYGEHFLDTLKQYFSVDFSNTEKYITGLNTNVLLRGYYDINGQNRISAQFQGQFMNSGFRPAMTLAYSGTFFNMIDVCATYTMMKGNLANLGLGLAGNFGTFHIYAATSNIFGVFNPMNTKGFNAQAGIVFNLRK